MQKEMDHEMKLGRYMDLETRTPPSGSRAPNSGPKQTEGARLAHYFLGFPINYVCEAKSVTSRRGPTVSQ